MVIREMSREECLQVLTEARLARLACARANQPYVVPVYLAYGEASGCLYGFTTLGQKVEWMRDNPQVCVEVDEITANDKWVSIIVIGRYEELPETEEREDPYLRALERPQHIAESAPIRSAESRQSQYHDERNLAWQVLNTHPEWWEPGCAAWAARIHNDPDEPYTMIYYKIQIDHVTGHEATRDPRDKIATADIPPQRPGWLYSALSRLFGDTSSWR